jgi:hypothetical protein
MRLSSPHWMMSRALLGCNVTRSAGGCRENCRNYLSSLIVCHELSTGFLMGERRALTQGTLVTHGTLGSNDVTLEGIGMS